MKKILYYLVFTALSFPYATYAIGLGSIDVHSYLNQPFYADIQLIDVGDTPLSGIQASIASPEDFKRAGLDREHMLDELIFKIEKKEGKPFIIVRSIDPISEPYLELLIDLSWANGQIYRAYTVLLDPPAYQLAGKSKKPTSAKTQYSSKNNRVPGTIDKDVVKDKLPEMPDAERRGAVTYGPTLASETIWQIAQRYKTKDVSLQQIILAIAGENPDAFKTGNINGLKKGVELKIPPTDIIRQIPAELAKQEVYEHDSAWQKKEPINHVLKPPYYEGDTADDNKTNDTGAATGKISYPSKLPSASHATAPGITSGDTSFFSPFIPKVTSFLSAGQDVPSQPSKTKVTQSTSNKQQDLIKAEMSIATAALN